MPKAKKPSKKAPKTSKSRRKGGRAKEESKAAPKVK